MLGIGAGLTSWRRLAVEVDFQAAITGLPGYHSWHSMRPEWLTLDSNGKIETIADRSGNGRTFGGVASNIRPGYVSDVLNGKGVARFVGPMALQYQAAHPTAAFTNVVVFRPAAGVTALQTVLGQSTTSNINHRIYLDTTTLAPRHQVQNAAVTATGSNISAGAIAANSWNVAIASFDGAATTVRLKLNANAALQDVRAGLSAVQDIPAFLGAGNTPGGVPSSPFTGDIADVLVLSTDILAPAQAASLALLRQYLAKTYGLAI